MVGQNFPVADTLRPQIIDAHTISRAGNWWTAILLIEDPRNEKPFIGFYKWQHTQEGWKTRSKFKLNKSEHVRELMICLRSFVGRME